MFKTKIGLFGIEESINKPVTIKITDDIKKILGLSVDTYTKLYINETIDRTKTSNGNIRSTSETRDVSIELDYNEMPAEGSELDLTKVYPNADLIYNDDDIDANIQPIYVDRTVTLEIKIHVKSRAKATAIINKLRLTMANNEMHNLHDLQYSYVIPNYVLELLNNINTLKNTHTIPALTLEEYLNNTFDDSIELVYPEDGNLLKLDVGIREQQRDIIGYITDDVSKLNKVMNKDDNSWDINFTYNFTYSKPIELILNYPLAIYNNLLDKKFYDFIQINSKTVNGRRRRGDVNIVDISNHRLNDILLPSPNNYCVTIPREDNIVLPKPKPYYARVLSVLSLVDINTPRLLFNLNDLPKITFKDIIKDYFLFSGNDLTKPYKSMFYFELYENGTTDPVRRISIDSNLELTVDIDLDVLCTYRVILNILVNTEILSSISMKKINTYLITNDKIDLVETFRNVLQINKDAFDIPYYHGGSKVKDMFYNIKEENWTKYYLSQVSLVRAFLFDYKK